MKQTKVTKELLKQLKTSKGAYSKGTILLLGLDYPAPKGWQDEVIGTTITISKQDEVPPGTLVAAPAAAPSAPTPANLLERAIDKGADLAQLEKLMDLQERWEKKEAAKAFNVALSNFQKDKPEINNNKKAEFKTKDGGKMSYTYAGLSYIQKKIDPVLSMCGLSYRWEQEALDGLIKITCIIKHEAGHEECFTLSGPMDTSGKKNSLQQIGSTITYLKRYTLAGGLGLSTSEDNDGVGAVDKERLKPEIKPQTEIWDQVVEAVAGGYGLKALRERYYLTAENLERLQDEAMEFIKPQNQN